MSDKTALYRIYGSDDRLLYVGVSKRLEARFGAHQRERPWHQVAHISIDWYESREEALRAESAAIEAEHPKWNVLGASDGVPARRGEGQPRSPLVGRFFHVPKLHACGCTTIEVQGQILEEVMPGLFLVGYFSWFHGMRTDHDELRDIEAMVDWRFFDDGDEMRGAFSNIEADQHRHFERCTTVFD